MIWVHKFCDGKTNRSFQYANEPNFVLCILLPNKISQLQLNCREDTEWLNFKFYYFIYQNLFDRISYQTVISFFQQVGCCMSYNGVWSMGKGGKKVFHVFQIIPHIRFRDAPSESMHGTLETSGPHSRIHTNGRSRRSMDAYILSTTTRMCALSVSYPWWWAIISKRDVRTHCSRFNYPTIPIRT